MKNKMAYLEILFKDLQVSCKRLSEMKSEYAKGEEVMRVEEVGRIIAKLIKEMKQDIKDESML